MPFVSVYDRKGNTIERCRSADVINKRPGVKSGAGETQVWTLLT